MKFAVTPEMADVIKLLRTQNHVASKDVADHIGKSPSYMSKLEQGDIKSIEEPELTAIFRFIFGNTANERDFFDASLAKIYEALMLNGCNEADLDRQLWLDNYDTVLRPVAMPPEMADDMSARIKQLDSFSVDLLCARINANEEIYPDITGADNYPFNEWTCKFDNNGQLQKVFIKMRVDPLLIMRLLTKEETVTNYVTLLAMSLYLLKTEHYGTQREYPESVRMDLAVRATKYLTSYQILSVRDSVWRQQQQERGEQELADDKNTHLLLAMILGQFQGFYYADRQRGQEYLRQLAENLKWDPGFTMRYISLPLSALKDLSYATRAQMLADIRNVIKRYEDMPREQRKMDLYD